MTLLARATTICRMKEDPKHDPMLRLVDAVLSDLAVRSAMYVGRRREAGDARTFVIQTGEEGRHRVSLPDLNSDRSIEVVVAEAAAHLEGVLGVPVPLCPLHQHALVGTVASGELRWVCPEQEWQCSLGDYEELTWPQLDVESLAPILSRRLERRAVTGVVTIAVARSERGLVAGFGVPAMRAELIRALREAAAPLPVAVHHDSRRMIRVGSLSQ